MHLTRRIFEDFAFDATATDVSTPVARVLEMKRGVCQDFAHLAIAAHRALGIPARYVSGYLMTRPPPGQVKLKGADASHAWLSVWSPEQGWVDFDPTNGIIPGGEHITLAYGRDYEDISPISGVLLGGGDQTMSVAVDVEPVA
jgi:transglutaminase-like putative cysteine protease